MRDEIRLDETRSRVHPIVEGVDRNVAADRGAHAGASTAACLGCDPVLREHPDDRRRADPKQQRPEAFPVAITPCRIAAGRSRGIIGLRRFEQTRSDRFHSASSAARTASP